MEEIEYFDDVYPLYEVQATIGVNSSAAKAQEAFVLYGIDSQYCGIEMEEQENSIFIPPKLQKKYAEYMKDKVELRIGESDIGKNYVFKDIRKSNNQAVYICMEESEKMLRETAGAKETYDGVCLRVTSIQGVEFVMKLEKELNADPLESCSDLIHKYEKASQSFVRILIIGGCLLLLGELFISIMVDKLIETLRIESEEEGMTQKKEKRIKRYWFVKMNFIMIFVVSFVELIFLMAQW
ncbi:MAG: hypothetical protein PHC41_11550 [Lachnospiraceae bacterium]|nr:hypothetical protein [Lachnospiraceae bacterium]MDD3616842.1 hypothetical protein [Lachnospiraceae bacterium]